jgi:hypothetical protein
MQNYDFHLQDLPAAAVGAVPSCSFGSKKGPDYGDIINLIN